MVYKKHSIWLIIRLSLIFGTMMCFPLTINLVEPGQQIFTLLVIALVLIALILELYYFLNRALRELTQFLEHIRNRDFSLRFNEEESRGVRKNLYRTFNEVLQVYREIQIEREVHFRFLEHMIELIEIGIMVFDRNGSVILWNTAASNLTGIQRLNSWEQMVCRNPDFAEKVGSINESGRVLYEKLNPGSTGGRFVVQVLRTRMLDQDYSLMTIQDISSVVDEKETGAWINLLRTLNHEIKNSVTPISSLADTIMMILMGEQNTFRTVNELDQENLTDIIKSVQTLQERSKNLCTFIDKYHKLTRLPVPDPEFFNVKSLFSELHNTFRNEMELHGIRFKYEEQKPGLEIRADRGLVGQVMINLIRNSMDAVHNRKDAEILLSCTSVPEGNCVYVNDNGGGIDEEILEDIFIPFFTTKTSGSGIGLSLVRQIMRLHGGHVRITSEKKKGTSVCLVFPSSSDPQSE